MIIGMKGDLGPKGSTGSPGAKGERGVTGPAGRNATLAGGVTYNRWGSAHCPTGAVLLYWGQLITVTKEVGQTTCACLTTQGSHQDIDLERKDTVTCMELNINLHW